jgi:hypothetical protein
MIQRMTEIKSVMVACLLAGAVVAPAKADDPKSSGVPTAPSFSEVPSRMVKQLEAKAEEQRAGVKALERLLEVQRKELRETEASLEAGRKFLAEMEAADRLAAVRRDREREKALKVLLLRERGTQEYLDRLNGRTPEGPATSLDSRIHASELELTKKDLDEIRAKIKSIQEAQATKPQP